MICASNLFEEVLRTPLNPVLFLVDSFLFFALDSSSASSSSESYSTPGKFKSEIGRCAVIAARSYAIAASLAVSNVPT